MGTGVCAVVVAGGINLAGAREAAAAADEDGM